MNLRVRALNAQPPRSGGSHVLYWSQMNRRTSHNHALLHAVELANDRGVPVLFYEGLGCTYKLANDRIHTFLLEGVADTQRSCAELGIGYAFYLRRRKDSPNDMLYRLAADAVAVVTDDYPTFIAPIHNASVSSKLDVAFHAVDSSCIVPMNLFEKREWAAYTIRPKINKVLGTWMKPMDAIRPAKKWKGAKPDWHVEVTDSTVAELVASCDIDHSVKPSISYRGGSGAADRMLRHFLERNLSRYANGRNSPSNHATSNLSPYLHFGHISALEVALRAKAWAEEHKLIPDEFLEELIVRRELAFNFARYAGDKLESVEALPDWAQRTLRKHAPDPRAPRYSVEQFERAQTHDDLWNATQKEMLLRGKIHGYYRMYWGKKIIEWSDSIEDAVATMIYMHDRYALDGRDPATYTNILWCLGLHDRPWTERPVFGQIRYMGLDGMKRKTDVPAYLKEIQFMEQTGKDPFRVE